MKTSSDLDLDRVGVGLHGPRRSWRGPPQSGGAMSLRPCPKPQPPPLSDANTVTQHQPRARAARQPGSCRESPSRTGHPPRQNPRQNLSRALQTCSFRTGPAACPPCPCPVMRFQSLWGLSPSPASRAKTHSGTRLPRAGPRHPALHTCYP